MDNPNPLTALNWIKELSGDDRKNILNLAKQYSTLEGKSLEDKYSTLLYALPLVVQDEKAAEDYVLLPSNLFGEGSDIVFYLITVDGKVKEKFPAETLKIKGTPIYTGYVVDYDKDKIFNIIDIKDIQKT